MKTHIVLPLPFDQWETFEPFVKRFVESFKKFPPGADYELRAACTWGGPTDEIRQLFYGTKTRLDGYWDNGCDIGAAQATAHGVDSEDLILAMTTRCYFHREGWLKRYVEAFEKHGPGLYGASASWEGGKPHICTRAYLMNAELWQRYPNVINTRENGQKFEVGEWCVSDWVREQGLPLVQVTWDGEQIFPNWRPPIETGIFRRGEQQAMLVWDKHTDLFRDADEATKLELQKMANPPSYSQSGEDRWILENLKLSHRGTFVEVGAYDGVTSSNTLLFEKLGWTGLLVEPDSEMAERCRRNRKVPVSELAASSIDGGLEFNVNQNDKGLSGVGRPGKPILVNCRRLDSMIDWPIDLLSIDTEGTELEVWKGLGEMRPTAVIIEHKTCDLPSQAPVIECQLRADGYRLVHATAHNLIFLRADQP